MSREEVNKLYKQASIQRKRMRRPSEGERQVSLDDLVFRLLQGAVAPDQLSSLETGTVDWAGPKTARIMAKNSLIQGETRTFQLGGQRAAVGDEVEIGLAKDGETWKLHRILPRRSQLSRPDVGNAHQERVIVANVETVVIVVSVVSPPLHPRLIDRYLIAIQRGGAQPVICVNKLDLLEDETELEVLEPYVSLNVPIVRCSTTTGRGIEDLRTLLLGRVAAFVGHSGVGKSSVMNALYPSLHRDTGEISEGYGRGTHTTTASQLFELPGGTRLIDTPGIRSFGLWQMSSDELKWYFPEFEGLHCRFNDCSHTHEPGCAVREAAESGAIHAVRYDTYLRLLKGA